MITQVTQLVEHARGSVDFLRALLVLVPIWWMYGGYVWLTNNVGATDYENSKPPIVMPPSTTSI